MSAVAIIGSGPAGLFAALAVEQAGNVPHIISKGEKSPMFGAMYLHEPLPGVNGHDPDFEIDIIKSGSREGYAYNVYGDAQAPCSWDVISEGYTPAWDLPQTYERLWDRYVGNIRRADVNASKLAAICYNYPLVLNSAPAEIFCSDASHRFRAQKIWVLHGPQINPVPGVNDGNIMYYNGVPTDGSFASLADDYKHDDGAGYGETYMRGPEWYRFSQINGYQAWEFSHKAEVADDNPRTLSPGRKPLSTDCDCFLSWQNYRRIGRYGKWEKGVLTHHAYRDAAEACRAVL